MKESSLYLFLSSKKMERYYFHVIGIIAVLFSFFHLYTATFGVLTAILQRLTHLSFALVLIFLTTPAFKRIKKFNYAVLFYDFALIVMILFAEYYMAKNFQAFVLRAGKETLMDLLVGAAILFLVLEGTRRKMDLVLPTIAIIFLIYGKIGPYMPGLLGHRGFSPSRIITHIGLSTEGIFGEPLGVSAVFVFLFILFGAFLRTTGGGDFFVELAHSLFGKVRGGPAKVSIVASSFFGTISGSAVANVVGTGTFTIPLMKKTGYKPHFAAAVEAAASTGGQFMPPVMGAAAFIMAEVIGVQYLEIAKAALIPALLYCFAIFIMVDLEAVKTGLKGLPQSDLPDAKKVFREGAHLLLSPIVLIIALAVFKYSPMKSALIGIVATIIVSFFRASSRLDAQKFYESLKSGALGALEVAMACATAGIVVGIFTLTGLGMKLSTLLVDISGGNLLILLFLTMLTSLILGMGMPTTAAYIVLAMTVAPAITRIGVDPIAAHLFVFYFGIISAITPPVALAAYAGAAIAETNPMKAGFTAWKIGLAAFLIPYMFVYGPPLLLQGSATQVIAAMISAGVGIVALGSGVQGYFLTKLNLIQRVIMIAASLLLIKAGYLTDIAGYSIVCVFVLLQLANKKSKKKVNPTFDQ